MDAFRLNMAYHHVPITAALNETLQVSSFVGTTALPNSTYVLSIWASCVVWKLDVQVDGNDVLALGLDTSTYPILLPFSEIIVPVRKEAVITYQRATYVTITTQYSGTCKGTLHFDLLAPVRPTEFGADITFTGAPLPPT